MRCPSCGTSHPSHYEQCVSCGKDFYSEDEILEETQEPEAVPSHVQIGQPEGAAPLNSLPPEAEVKKRPKQHHDINRNGQSWGFDDEPKVKRRSESMKHMLKSGAPQAAGAITAIVILLVSAGATLFFLTKAPESDRLLLKGLKELDNGQYAFAVETLTKASENKNAGPKVQLALARAYIGVDQVDKAWQCIDRAKQEGQGIIEDPELASQLANYYRQHAQYERAIQLLRPLAQKNIPGKRGELADLAALFGDEELREGHTEAALRHWEEVRELKEGTRYTEAEARLATIYQKLAEKLAAEKKDKEALGYLSKLNAIADNPRNYEMAADLYERSGQLELAIDQLRKASKLQTSDDGLRRKLAVLLTKRGKELLDKGELDTGYGYLQQAKSMDPSNSVPTVTMKLVKVDFVGGMPRLSGQVWNPTDDPINALSMKVEICNSEGQVIWSKETRVVDEYVPPLGAKDGKNVDITGGESVKADGKSEFKVYFDGKLYNSYPIGKRERAIKTEETAKEPVPETTSPSIPATAPDIQQSQQQNTPPVAPTPGAQPRNSAEEKTMKDLE